MAAALRHEPVLFEEAPRPRTGGYVIDFWGVGYDVAEKMGLVPTLQEAGYRVGEWRLVDGDGRRTGGFSTQSIEHLTNGRVISLERSALAGTLYHAVKDRVETVFGNSVAAIEETPVGVRIALDRGESHDFDLVVGADGLHSRVRGLVFGPEERFDLYLGFRVAAFQVRGYRPRDELVYVSHTEPGRQISRFAMRDDRTLFLLVFHADGSDTRLPATDAERKAVLRELFGKMGWEAPQILVAMEGAEGIYLDRVAQIRMDRWTRGRTALVGDAAAAGEGTGLAMAEAYVLAGELHRANGDHAAAFARYEERLRDFIRGKQDGAKGFASAFAPQTRFGIMIRDLATRLMAVPFLADAMLGNMRDEIERRSTTRLFDGLAGRGIDPDLDLRAVHQEVLDLVVTAVAPIDLVDIVEVRCLLDLRDDLRELRASGSSRMGAERSDDEDRRGEDQTHHDELLSLKGASLEGRPTMSSDGEIVMANRPGIEILTPQAILRRM